MTLPSATTPLTRSLAAGDRRALRRSQHDLPACGSATRSSPNSARTKALSGRNRAAIERCARRRTCSIPDPRGAALKSRWRSRWGIGVDRIVLGNGSHELLMMLTQCFADPAFGRVLAVASPSIRSRPPRPARAQRCVPALHATFARPDFGNAMAAATLSTRLVYLANPNNPTGTWFGDGAITCFLENVPRDVLVVVDRLQRIRRHAGFELALKARRRSSNLIVARTFSRRPMRWRARAGLPRRRRQRRGRAGTPARSFLNSLAWRINGSGARRSH